MTTGKNQNKPKKQFNKSTKKFISFENDEVDKKEKAPRKKTINKSTKKSIVFDEKKRKEFLTGFRKRKDERRKKWNEKVERDLKKEIKKIKDDTRAKVSLSEIRTLYFEFSFSYMDFRWRRVRETRAT